jgi:hypothetical protein
MTWAVTVLHFPLDDRLCSQVSPYGICGGLSDSGARLFYFFQTASVSSCHCPLATAL